MAHKANLYRFCCSCVFVAIRLTRSATTKFPRARRERRAFLAEYTGLADPLRLFRPPRGEVSPADEREKILRMTLLSPTNSTSFAVIRGFTSGDEMRTGRYAMWSTSNSGTDMRRVRQGRKSFPKMIASRLCVSVRATKTASRRQQLLDRCVYRFYERRMEVSKYLCSPFSNL